MPEAIAKWRKAEVRREKKAGEWKKPEWSLDAKSVAPLPTYDSADDKHNALLGACYAASPYQAARDATRSGYGMICGSTSSAAPAPAPRIISFL